MNTHGKMKESGVVPQMPDNFARFKSSVSWTKLRRQGLNANTNGVVGTTLPEQNRVKSSRSQMSKLRTSCAA